MANLRQRSWSSILYCLGAILAISLLCIYIANHQQTNSHSIKTNNEAIVGTMNLKDVLQDRSGQDDDDDMETINGAEESKKNTKFDDPFLKIAENQEIKIDIDPPSMEEENRSPHEDLTDIIKHEKSTNKSVEQDSEKQVELYDGSLAPRFEPVRLVDYDDILIFTIVPSFNNSAYLDILRSFVGVKYLLF